MSRQSRFDARYWMLGADALGQPRGMVWGGRREEGSGWGTRVYMRQFHVDIRQNQYNIVKLKSKIKKKKSKLQYSMCASQDSAEKQNRVYMYMHTKHTYIKKFVLGNWLDWL